MGRGGAIAALLMVLVRHRATCRRKRRAGRLAAALPAGADLLTCPLPAGAGNPRPDRYRALRRRRAAPQARPQGPGMPAPPRPLRAPSRLGGRHTCMMPGSKAAQRRRQLMPVPAPLPQARRRRRQCRLPAHGDVHHLLPAQRQERSHLAARQGSVHCHREGPRPGRCASPRRQPRAARAGSVPPAEPSSQAGGADMLRAALHRRHSPEPARMHARSCLHTLQHCQPPQEEPPAPPQHRWHNRTLLPAQARSPK